MKVLGIDPGSRKTGYGIAERSNHRQTRVCSGTWFLNTRASLEERLVQLGESLEALIDEFQPEAAAVEKVFLAKNARSALVLGHARGVVLFQLARKNIPIFEYSATEVKQSMVGAGRADKSQVAHMVQVLLNYRVDVKEDEADALAVALTHLHINPKLTRHGLK